MPVEPNPYDRPDLLDLRKDQEDPIFLYFVVRKSVSMTPGKLAAQIGHAMGMLMGRYYELMMDDALKIGCPDPEDDPKVLVTTDWLATSYRKATLVADDKEWEKLKEQVWCFVVNLVRRFAEAGLQLVLSDRPIVGGLGGRGAASIVQIDIQRAVNGSRRREWFRIFPGAEENRIEVVGIDKKIAQLVLMVHEPQREFFEDVPFSRVKDYDTSTPGWIEELAKNLQVRVGDVAPNIGRGGMLFSVRIRRKSPSQKRHFLCGVDERQLFIAQLPKAVSTVREAHASLKRPELLLAEGRVGRATRQGEFFFVPSMPPEIDQIEHGLKKNTLIIERSVPIGPFMVEGAIRGQRVRQFRGNPHTADELVISPGVIRGREIFIRGRVRHVDHATVKFSQWVKVILNAEANQGQAFGGWID